MLDSKFFALDEFNPSLNVLYDLMTVQRIFFTEDNARLARWGVANGALSEVLLPRDGAKNQIAVYKDANKAIIFCEGTTNEAQLFSQAVNSHLVSNPHLVGKVGSYWSFYFTINRGRVLAALAGLPSDATILFVGHSLGSALALCLANYCKAHTSYTIAGVVAFGAMRVGNAAFTAAMTMPVIRWANIGDVITQIPLSVIETAAIGSPLLLTHRYEHTHDGWQIDVNGLYTRVGFVGSGTLADAVVYSALLQGIFEPSFFGNHFYTEYLRRLRLRETSQFGFGSFDATSKQLNTELDAIEGGSTPVIEPPLAEPIPERRWVDIDLVVPDDGAAPIVPPEDLVKTYEVRSVAHVLFTYGGPFPMASVYRGRDRRMLQTLVKVASDILERDVRTTDPKPTRRLSSRQIMFPAGGTPDKLVALNLVITQATALLAQTK